MYGLGYYMNIPECTILLALFGERMSSYRGTVVVAVVDRVA